MGDETGATTIQVEVAVAWPELQIVVPLELPAGATVIQAVRASGLKQRFPSLEVAEDRLGVFAEKRNPDDILIDGDRVEIYRPLKMDPKEARRLAAAARKA